MPKVQPLTITLFGLLFSYLPLHSKTSPSFDLGLSISAGYTALDFEAASGYPDSLMDDWDQFHYKITAYGLFPLSSTFSAGLELGYNYLYYYYYRIPYGTSPVYREAQWSTISCLGMVRYDLS